MSRYYDDGRVPSVTTVLSHGSFSFEQAAAKYPQQMKSATDRGTQVHALIELYLKDDPRLKSTPISPEAAPYFSAFIPALDKIKASGVTIQTEVEVRGTGGEGLDYGGTIDVILTDRDNTRTVIDWKTCNKAPSQSTKNKWFLQGAAYAHCVGANKVVIAYAYPTKKSFKLKFCTLNFEQKTYYFNLFRTALIEFYKAYPLNA